MSDDRPERTSESTQSGDTRDVVVPLRVYKAVTVFSTLFAVVCVVGGFLLVDQATDRATAPVSEIDPLIAIAGIGLIVLGAGTYAFATRFRTAEMGTTNADRRDT